jgi:hypothetical protein
MPIGELAARLRDLRALRVLLLLALAGCETAPPGAPGAQEILAAKTKAQLLRATTLEPTRCVWSRPGYELCAWQLGDRNAAWYALADTIGTRHRVNLICELRLDDAPRERACLVVPAASPPTTGSSRSRIRISPAAAQSALDAATNVWELSELVGDVPERCHDVAAETKLCVWRANRRTHGFATLRPLLESRAPVQLSCELPADGSDRAHASCRALPS